MQSLKPLLAIVLAAIAFAFVSWDYTPGQLQPAPGISQAQPKATIAVAQASTVATTPAQAAPAPGSNEVEIPRVGADKPEEPEPVDTSTAFLYAGGIKWARIGTGFLANPSDDLAKLGYQEITFLPDGTYEWEGWKAFVNFKKVGRYEMRGQAVFMRDERILWMKDDKGKPADIRNLIWVEGTYARYNTSEDPRVPILEVLEGDGFNSVAHYDWKIHRIVGNNGKILDPLK